jgi:hypothetical protein
MSTQHNKNHVFVPLIEISSRFTLDIATIVFFRNFVHST